VKILLDTHILLWSLSDNPQLSEKAKEILMNEKNHLYYSIVSLWELELKHIAKPNQIHTSAQEVHAYCQDSGAFELLDISLNDIFTLHELERRADTPPHKDPFDRLLLMQAINNDFKFMTHDFLITGYDTENIIYV